MLESIGFILAVVLGFYLAANLPPIVVLILYTALATTSMLDTILFVALVFSVSLAMLSAGIYILTLFR